MREFIRRYLPKPSHKETVVLQLFPVVCVCGTVFYITQKLKSDDRCPDCGEPPRPGRIGALEEVTTEVQLKFGGGPGHIR